MTAGPGRAETLKRSLGDWILPAAAVAIVFVMLVPLPALVLDFLLALSITTSVLVLLSAVHILRPVQFSVFPSLLLLLTLFRLALNLASSRRILLHGNEGISAAGGVIAAFGQFVVGGNYGVGSANLVFLPAAGKLRSRFRDQQILRAMTLEGVISIVEGMNPRMLEHKLNGFLKTAKDDVQKLDVAEPAMERAR